MDSAVKSSQIAALDIGTAKISVVVADVDDTGEIRVVGIGKVDALGIYDGSIQDVELAVDSIRKAVAEAEAMSGRKITTVSAALTGKYLHSVNRKGRLVLRENEVTAQDVQRVTRLAMAFDPKNDSRGRGDDDRVVSHLVKGYTLDNDTATLIADPVGMSGNVIHAHVHLAVGSESIVANLIRCIRRAGLDVEVLILQPWASAASCLTPTDKELGVIMMDFGAGSVDLACYERSRIEKTEVIPVGGNLFTRDIAGVLGCSLDDADDLKPAYAHIGMRPGDDYETIRYVCEATREEKVVPCRKLVEVVTCRAEEILKVIRDRFLAPENWLQRAAGGIVITGGCTRMPGFAELVAKVMQLPVRLASPGHKEGNGSEDLIGVEDSTAIGVIIETVRRRRLSGKARAADGHLGGFMAGFKRMIFGDFSG